MSWNRTKNRFSWGELLDIATHKIPSEMFLGVHIILALRNNKLFYFSERWKDHHFFRCITTILKPKTTLDRVHNVQFDKHAVFVLVR